MANSGISHTVSSVPIPRSTYESEVHHDIVSGTSFPVAPVEKQLFYRTDLHLLYIYNGTSWVDCTSQGVTVHNNLTNRDAADCHPLAAITGLSAHGYRHQNGGADWITLAGLPGESAALAAHKILTSGVHSFYKYCHVYMSANQNVANLTLVTALFDSEYTDTDAMHDIVTNNSRLTCKTEGIYLVAAIAAFASNATGVRFVEICYNGSQDAVTGANALNGDNHYQQCLTMKLLNPNDYMELKVVQTSGGNLNLLGGANFATQLMMARIA